MYRERCGTIDESEADSDDDETSGIDFSKLIHFSKSGFNPELPFSICRDDVDDALVADEQSMSILASSSSSDASVTIKLGNYERVNYF